MSENEGEVSETQNLGESGPISPGDYTAGNPVDEPDDTDNAGPDAVPENNEDENEYT